MTKIDKILKKINSQEKISKKEERKQRQKVKKLRQLSRMLHAKRMAQNDTYVEEQLDRERVIREVEKGT